MKNIFTSLLIFISISLSAQFTWIKRADFPDKRYVPYSFSYNGKIYVGGGQTTTGALPEDLWEFNPVTNTWTQKQSLPAGKGRYGTNGVIVNGKAYLVSGWNNSSPHELSDVWEYNFSTDSWTQKANLIDTFTGRYAYASFVVGDKAYFGTGYGYVRKDFASYDPATDKWSKLADFPGAAREATTYFSNGNFGYVGLGTDANTSFKDWYKYNTTNNTWTKLADFPGTARENTMNFILNNKGYVIGGKDIPFANLEGNQVWEFDFADDNWLRLNNLPDTLFGGIGAATATSGFVGLGSHGTTGFNLVNNSNHFWELKVSTDIETVENNLDKIALAIHHNKRVDLIFSDLSETGTVSVYDLTGKLLLSQKIAEKNLTHTLDLSGFSSSVYILDFNCATYNYSNKFILK